jgi:hypothetical protein
VSGLLFCQSPTRHCNTVNDCCAPITAVEETDRNTNAWFSCLLPNRAQDLLARPSASPIALPSFPPFGPLDDDVYVFRQIKPCDERRAVGRET